MHQPTIGRISTSIGTVRGPIYKRPYGKVAYQHDDILLLFIVIIDHYCNPLLQSIIVMVSRCHGFMVICLLAVVIYCNRNKQGKIQAMSMFDPNLTTAPFLVHVELIAIHLLLLSLPRATKNIAIS